jgi:hypothetical protein
MDTSEQPERYCECPNHALTDSTPYNSAVCAVCSQNKGPIDSPDNSVISSTVPDDGIIYWTFRNAKPFKTMNGACITNSSIRAAITKRQDREGIKQVVDQFDRRVLVKAIRCLLREGVFQDPLKAKLKFPHLFPDTMAPGEEAKDSASQENVAPDTSSEQAPGRTTVDWDEWLSVGRYSQKEDEGEVNEEESTSVARMTKSHTVEDELPHAVHGGEEAAISTEIAQTEEGVDIPGILLILHTLLSNSECLKVLSRCKCIVQSTI